MLIAQISYLPNPRWDLGGVGPDAALLGAHSGIQALLGCFQSYACVCMCEGKQIKMNPEVRIPTCNGAYHTFNLVLTKVRAAGLSPSTGGDSTRTKIRSCISQCFICVSLTNAGSVPLSSAVSLDHHYVLFILLLPCLPSCAPTNRSLMSRIPDSACPPPLSPSPHLSLLCLTFTDTWRQIYFTLRSSLTPQIKEDFCCVTVSRRSGGPGLSDLGARTCSHLRSGSPRGLNVTFC